VMIWDRGHWEPEADPHKGLAKGHLAFRLYGEKLHGGWHLVRMHRRQGEKRDNWLLIKQHDGSERSARDEDILEEKPLSVVTGRTMDEITSGPKKEWRTNRASKTKQLSGKPKAVKRGTAREATVRGRVPAVVYYPGARRDGGSDGTWLRITPATSRPPLASPSDAYRSSAVALPHSWRCR